MLLLPGQELVKGIERHKLDARLGKNLFPGYNLEGFFHHAPGAVVPVVVGAAQEGILFPQQAKVHAPGVNGQAFQACSVAGYRLAQAIFHFVEEA
ncbi:hypothetical protein MOST_12450 [Moorella stamsii]|uniref:Uncharacterized protein n=1 Tax=Neomoorella stamsii TaxID=1266720 RepID=A0A9X7P6N8_9FIRM|nr:hypothetical protein MOST_12450 [Moorella stamsii]